MPSRPSPSAAPPEELCEVKAGWAAVLPNEDAALCGMALNQIIVERKRQHKKWGRQRHPLSWWLTILTEELGEASKAMLERDEAAARRELIEVAAVAVAWLEQMVEQDVMRFGGYR